MTRAEKLELELTRSEARLAESRLAVADNILPPEQQMLFFESFLDEVKQRVVFGEVEQSQDRQSTNDCNSYLR